MIKTAAVSIIGGVLACIAVFATTVNAGAMTNTTLNQKVLPLDCQFTIIDSGTNQIVYLTPTECGQAVTPSTPGTGTTTPAPTEETEASQGALVTPIYYYAQGVQLPSLAGPYNETNGTGDIIRLNLFPEYRKEGEAPAKRLTLVAGQPVLFTIKTITYVFMIKEITADSVTFIVYPQARNVAYGNVLASEVFQATLRIGEAGEYDINNDQQANIRIFIADTIANKAIIDFKELKTETTKSGVSSESAVGWYWWLWVLGAVVALAAWWFIVWRRRRRKEEEDQ